MVEFELSILAWIQTYLRNPINDVIFVQITHLGMSGLFCIIIATLMVIFPKTRRFGIVVALGLLFNYLLCNIALKPIFNRPRPYTYVDILLLVAGEKDASFPSGHTSSWFALALSLFFVNKKVGKIALVVAILVAFSRLYLHVHFPTDVLGGMISGCLGGIFSTFLHSTVLAKKKYLKPSF